MISPVIKFYEFSVSGIDPSGSRHLQASTSGFVKELSTTGGEFLNFGAVNVSDFKQHTGTKAVSIFISDMQDANEAVFNMRFWLSDTTNFLSGSFFFNGLASGVWIQNAQLTDASGSFTPTILPSGQNLRRWDGNNELTAANLDSQVCEWMFLSLSLDTDVPNKTYGGDSGGFVYHCTFDYR